MLSHTDGLGHTTRYSYGAGDRLATATDKKTGGVTRYSYDGAGRLTGKAGPAGTETYAYDASGRLMSFTGTDGKQTDYTYNALGVLLQAGDTELVSDYASAYRNLLSEDDGSVERRYVYGRDRIGVQVTANGQSGRYSLLSDRLGSTERALDSAGRLAGMTQYDPWGVARDNIPVTFTGQKLDLTSSYTGYWLDNASGLWYALNRMYSPQDRRFTSVDPASGSLADPVSGMPYLYARNNPYAYVDPSGRSFLGVNWDYIVDPLKDHYTYTTVLYCDVPVGSYMEHQRGVVSRVKQAVGGGARAVGGALTMLGSGALAAASGGTLTPISGLGVVVGAGNLALGSSEFFEAFTDHNTVRDTWMGGNQDLYNGVSLGFGLAEIPTGMLLGNALAKVPPRQTTTNGGYNAGTVQPGYQGQLALPPGQPQFALPPPQTPPMWKGSGPAPGVLGINSNSLSNLVISNYYPKEGAIEFVFDAATNTFVVGQPLYPIADGSGHQKLADILGAEQGAPTTLGGMFSRGRNGEIFTTEYSGHFGRNWTPELRDQFQSIMQQYGLNITHAMW